MRVFIGFARPSCTEAMPSIVHTQWAPGNKFHARMLGKRRHGGADREILCRADLDRRRVFKKIERAQSAPCVDLAVRGASSDVRVSKSLCRWKVSHLLCIGFLCFQ